MSIDNQPIFIAGPDRSGTTLLYALLASHPNISMVRRTNFWRWFYGRYGDLSNKFCTFIGQDVTLPAN